MSTILLDNATVSSVQRALGFAPLHDPSLLDIEHAALGRFCESYLLAGKTLVPDNYKEELSAERKEFLTRLGIDIHPVPESRALRLSSTAKTLLETWTDAYVEGQNRGSFDRYFSQVNAYSEFIWEYTNSAFFLVFRAHGIDKENPLIEALLSTNGSAPLGKQLRILAKDGSQVKWHSMSPHVKRMLCAMGWLGHQYVWYQATAARYEATYYPHPLREFFANDFLDRLGRGSIGASEFTDAFFNGMTTFAGRVQDCRQRLRQRPGAATFHLPPFLQLLARAAVSPADFLASLQQLRDDKNVTELREHLAEVQRRAVQGEYEKVSSLVRDMESIGSNLLRQHGLVDSGVRISPPLTLIGIKVEGDPLSLRCPLPAALYKQFFVGRTYRAAIRDVMEEIMYPARLAQAKTKLNSWARIEGEKNSKFYLNRSLVPSPFFDSLETSMLERHTRAKAGERPDGGG